MMRLQTLKDNLETLKKDAEKIKNLTGKSLPLEDGGLMYAIEILENAIEKEKNEQSRRKL